MTTIQFWQILIWLNTRVTDEAIDVKLQGNTVPTNGDTVLWKDNPMQAALPPEAVGPGCMVTETPVCRGVHCTSVS